MMSWPQATRSAPTTFGGLRRGELMARVRSRRNETTEQRLGALLREARLKGWRRHAHLWGSPDFTWRDARVAVFVNGCFWNGHDCKRNLKPKTNPVEWHEKIRRNRVRDRRVARCLRDDGLSVLRVWECVLAP